MEKIGLFGTYYVYLEFPIDRTLLSLNSPRLSLELKFSRALPPTCKISADEIRDNAGVTHLVMG